MRPTSVVWFKELVDTLRDRRTLWAMVLGPVLVMPLLILIPQYLVRQQMQAQETATLRVAVTGAAHAPGRPAGLAVLGDGTKLASTRQAARLEGLLQAYAQGIVAQRLAARGVDVTLLEPFSVDRRNLATPRQMGGAFLGMMLPLFVVLWALVGGMYTAIDVTAGEKERQTLDPLLTTPASRLQLLLGKLMAVITTSLSAMVLAVGSMLVAFVLAEPIFADTGTEVAFRLSPVTALLVLVAAFPVVLMFAALELAVCLFARSFKEAQNYIVPLQFVVLIPAMAVIVAPDLTPPPAAFAAPVFGPLAVLRNLFLGTATGVQFGVMFGSSLVYAGLSLALAASLFRRERVLFRT